MVATLTLWLLTASGFELQVSELSQARTARFTVTGAEPGATVVVAMGVSVTDPCDEGARCLAAGVELGRVVADASGEARLVRELHARAPVGEFAFQAVAAGDTWTPVVVASVRRTATDGIAAATASR